MKTDEYTIEKIEKEVWQEAEGVKFTGKQTNSALTERDYSIRCEIPNKICCIKGYHLWWCSTHHQPSRMCDIGRLKERINKNCLVLLRKDLPTTDSEKES